MGRGRQRGGRTIDATEPRGDGGRVSCVRVLAPPRYEMLQERLACDPSCCCDAVLSSWPGIISIQKEGRTGTLDAASGKGGALCPSLFRFCLMIFSRIGGWGGGNSVCPGWTCMKNTGRREKGQQITVAGPARDARLPGQGASKP